MSKHERPKAHKKPPVDPASLIHRVLRDGYFWQQIPAWRDVSEDQFLDYKWQARNSITKPERLLATLPEHVPQSFFEDVAEGFRRAPMSVRVSPYIFSLINWLDPYDDPLRIQFIPVGSRILPDHPKLTLDSLNEQSDSPVIGLTHRYNDKALFLTLDTCPVYCRFCTRSYAVGIDTEGVEKVSIKTRRERWDETFAYIASRPELEDITISGGDCYQLKPGQIKLIGETLLEMDNIRRIRFATKGPAVMPQKILSDPKWVNAITEVVERGRKLGKEVCMHTHFNQPNEITAITKRAMDTLFERGITVRNQTVLQRGVNDTVQIMRRLAKRLSYCNVHPYYVFMHDLVKGVEDLRTTLQTGLDLEKAVRGSLAGFNTPLVMVDAPGGGGKRDAHSFEHYDRHAGIAVYTAPAVKSGFFYYFDPIDTLSAEMQERWKAPAEQDRLVSEATEAAKRHLHDTAAASSVRK